MFGIIGNGFVGQATRYLIGDSAVIYDIDPEKCVPKGTVLGSLCECKAVFICVPTPMDNNGKCCTKIVETCIKNLRSLGYLGCIIVRSTVPSGFCRNNNVDFMPEFLTEKNWKQDCINCENWYVSGDEAYDCVQQILTRAEAQGRIKFDTLTSVYSRELEFAKISRNVFLALKVSFFNELASFANHSIGINWDIAHSVIVQDSRIGESHTNVPGHDNKKGYGGTCFPKDIHSLQNQFRGWNVPSPIINACISRNEEIDRPEQDWNADKGRAVV
jgi:UDPglucose 6-dehydrogenase